MRTAAKLRKLVAASLFVLTASCSVDEPVSREAAVSQEDKTSLPAEDSTDLNYLAWRLNQEGDTCTKGVEAYQKTIYPLIRERCTKCHNDGPGEIADGPDFASSNVTTSYLHVKNLVNFSNMESSKLVDVGGNLHCLVQYGHPCNTDRPELLQMVQNWWDQGEKDCPSAGRYFTLGSKLPENLPNREQGFVTVRWPLDHIGGSLVGGVFEVEAQKFGEAPTDGRPAYRFRRPRLALASGKVLVKDLKVLINGQYDQLGNAFTKVENIVEGRPFDSNDTIWPFPNLSHRSLILLGNNAAADNISVSFGELAESQTSTQCKNIEEFKVQMGPYIKARNCVGCHAKNPEINLAAAFKRLALDGTVEEQCRLMKERIEVAYPYLSSIIDYVVRGSGVHAQIANSAEEFSLRWLDWYAAEGAFTTAGFTDPALLATQALQENYNKVSKAYEVRRHELTQQREAEEIKQLALGQDHVCVLFSSGKVKCWGQNDSGQLGLGDQRVRGALTSDMGNSLPYLALTADTAKVTKLSLGSNFSCALFDNGKVKCWGSNDSGQLGLPNMAKAGNTPETTPDKLPYIDIGSSQPIVEFDAGVRSTCVVLANGEVKCWGNNQIGQLGQGDRINRGSTAETMGAGLNPVQLPSDRKATQIGIGNRHVCAVLDNKDIACWGDGTYGVLGTQAQTPVGIAPDQMGNNLKLVDLGVPSNWVIKNLQVGFVHNCVLYTNGVTKCWGYNKDGRLGLGDSQDRGSGVGPMGSQLKALNVAPLNVAQELSCHFRHCCETFISRNAKCWGINSYGQLGNGDLKSRGLVPLEMGVDLPFVTIGTLSEVKQVVAGGDMSCALFVGNQVKCWGSNNFGQLGLGDKVHRSEAQTLGDNLPYVKLN